MERLKKMGQVTAVSSSQVKKSVIGIGFEKLDRGVFDPEKAYDLVAATGAKWVRIQSGWARTEKVRGEYDFAWLDAIVDNLLRRGLQPWVCLCYGNGLYDEAAAKIFGAVGCPPIKTAEQKIAWHRYVAALTARYRGRIQWYEVWNEPDGSWCWKHGPSGTEYGNFVVATAAAVKEGDPDAKVIGGCQCMFNLEWLSEVLRSGAGKVMDAYSYHNYAVDETPLRSQVASMRALCRTYNPDIQIIQGETGTQSRSDGAGALSGGAWTPRKQAKYLVRHTINDLMSDVLFCSYFSCVDMIEALNGTLGDRASYLDYGYFGILSAQFDENGIATGKYTPKPSYRAFQVLASIFREEFTRTELPLQIRREQSPRIYRPEDSAGDLMSCAFRKPDGSAAFAYWKPAELLTTDYESTITVHCVLPGKTRLIDPLDGAVYEFPDTMEIRGKAAFRKFEHIPVRDYPLLLTFGEFAQYSC